MALLEATEVWKRYDAQGKALQVLQGADLTLGSGEFWTVLGASGSGKSTLLHILGGLDRPDQGTVVYAGKNLYDRRPEQLAKFRNGEVGFVFQFYHLLPELTACENVMLPCLIAGQRRTRAKDRAEQLLDSVGMRDRATHHPQALSGGEQQRVALARAIANRPRLVLADEPTGNLDAAMGMQVMQLLRSLWREEGMTVVMVTHNEALCTADDRRVRLAEGVLHAA